MRYRFSNCELDTEQDQLYRAGQPVPLRRKAFDLLVYLIKHPGITLGKDDLVGKIWPEVVISDATLNSSIREVRYAIGDSGTEQRLIRTIYGKGYSFVGHVSRVDRDEQLAAIENSLNAVHLTCPYPGVVPYSAEDASHFFGRESEIEQIVSLLHHQSLIMVIGPSGSGKSSLVYAGLLPELTRTRHFEEDYWLVRQMRPGSTPCDSLGRIFETNVERGLDIDIAAQLLGLNPPARRLLLLVDQFEEVFTQTEREETSRFFGALRDLRNLKDFTLVLTMRADFYPDLMNCPLWPIDVSQRIEVAPLRGVALRKAIKQPAANIGVQIEPDLIERLLVDAADEPGVLPMLQETMRLLWADMEDRVLTYAAYERLNYKTGNGNDEETAKGLTAAIAMKADAALAELSPDQQTIARRFFLRLVQFGEGRADTRRQQPLSALRTTSDNPTLFESTLNHLTENRLLTQSGGNEREGSFVDIAHESLINGWARLRDWTLERREAEQVRRRLEAKVAEWKRLGRDTGGLLDKAQLPEAERWLDGPDASDLGASESLSEFVRVSKATIERAEQEREEIRQRELVQAQTLAETKARSANRLRHLSTLLGGVFILALIAAFVAWQQREAAKSLAEQETIAREEAELRRSEAEQARALTEQLRKNSIAQLLLTIAPEQQAIHEHQRAALMARQAYLMSANDSPLIRDLADRVIRNILRNQGFGPNLTTAVDQVAFSPDGRSLVASSRTGNKHSELLFWNLDNHGASPTVLAGPTDRRVFALAFHSNGKTLVTGDRAGVVMLRNIDKPDEPPIVLAELNESIWSIVFNQGDRFLAAGSKDSDKVWLIDTNNLNQIIDLSKQYISEKFPDAVLAEGTPVVFSPDGTMLAAGSQGGSIRIWSIDDLDKPISEFPAHEGPILSLAFSPDGKRLASGGLDATVRIWDLHGTDQPYRTLGGLEQRVTYLAFHSNNHQLLVGVSDRVRYSIRRWDLGKKEINAVVLHSDLGFNNLALSPDKQIAAVSDSGPRGLRLLDLRPSGRPKVLTSKYGDSFGLAFSPDDQMLAAAMKEDVIQLWDLNNLSAKPVQLIGHKGFVGGLAFGHNGRVLSSVGNDKTIRLWRLADPTEQIAIIKSFSDQWIAPFTPDGKSLAIVEWSNEVDTAFVKLRHISDMKTDLTVIQTPMKQWVIDVRISPDGRWIAAAGKEGIIHLEDLKRLGKNARTLHGHDDRIWTLAFSPDSRYLASGGRDRTVRIWDLTEADISSKIVGRHDDDVVNVRFSPDGKTLISSSWDQSIQLRDLTKPDSPPKFLMGQDARVWALALSHDGRRLASGGGEKGVLFWDLTHKTNSAPLEDLVDSICQKVWRNLSMEEWTKFVSEDLPYERTCPNLPAHPTMTAGL